MTRLHVEILGAGAPTLLLLHGVSANGGVWQPLLAELRDWSGRVVVPDLRGHGRSPAGPNYGLGQHAADVADLFAPGERLHLVGHSMGGAVGLLLASGCFGVAVERVLAFGTKVAWTAEEIAKAHEVAAAPARRFDSHAAAAERFLRVAGLVGIAGDLSAAINAGVVADDGRFRLAADPATLGVVGPPFDLLYAVARAPVRLACGSRDPLVGIAELRAFDRDAMVFDGCGHNAHVEAPRLLAQAMNGWFAP